MLAGGQINMITVLIILAYVLCAAIVGRITYNYIGEEGADEGPSPIIVSACVWPIVIIGFFIINTGFTIGDSIYSFLRKFD